MTSLPAGEQHTGTLNLIGHGNPQERDQHAAFIDTLAEPAIIAAGRANVAGMGGAQIRAAIEAVYPAIRQHVAEQIAAKLDGCYASVQRLAEENRQRSIDAGGRETYEGDRYMRLAISQKNRAEGLHGAATVAREIGGQG